MSTTPPTPAPRRTGDDSGLLRIGLHLLLAALPLLAISAHVFGLVRMQMSAALLVIPLATAVIALSVFSPHGGDRVLAHGLVWGIVACAIYDVFRLDTVYMLGWWDDFIPTMGTWITGNPDDRVSGAIVGYLWRYIGDGGGIGITFFALASAIGLHRRPRGVVVAVAVGFAVFPVWSGLIATVGLAPEGQQMMFPLTPTTITLSLIGHLIFGLILGLGFWRSRAVQEHWPWEPVTGESLVLPRRGIGPPPISGPLALPAAAQRYRTAPPTPPGGRRALGRPDPASPPSLPGPAAPPSISGPLPVQDGRLRRTERGGAPTPPSGQTLDPETWELWQRQLQTTVRGRRTHRSARSGRTRIR